MMIKSCSQYAIGDDENGNLGFFALEYKDSKEMSLYSVVFDYDGVVHHKMVLAENREKATGQAMCSIVPYGICREAIPAIAEEVPFMVQEWGKNEF